MLPLIAAVGGVIGTVISVAKGASWLADQLSATKNGGSAGGKSGLTPLSAADTASFAATLAAHSAGQLPPAATGSVATSAIMPLSGGTDYDMLARMKAGTIAYSHIGEHHGNRAGAVSHPDADGSATVAQG